MRKKFRFAAWQNPTSHGRRRCVAKHRDKSGEFGVGSLPVAIIHECYCSLDPNLLPCSSQIHFASSELDEPVSDLSFVTGFSGDFACGHRISMDVPLESVAVRAAAGHLWFDRTTGGGTFWSRCSVFWVAFWSSRDFERLNC